MTGVPVWKPFQMNIVKMARGKGDRPVFSSVGSQEKVAFALYVDFFAPKWYCSDKMVIQFKKQWVPM